MNIHHIDDYVNLFIKVFNGEPWNDSWTLETAEKRIIDMMSTSTFYGLALYEDNRCIGIIFGQKEQYYNGIHFQIQEFCIDNDYQRNGYGTFLLNEFLSKLESMGIYQIYLLTCKGYRTECFYNKNDFISSNDMVLMFKKNSKF